MKVVILVFVGIPATGKTTLSQHLGADALLKDFKFIPFCYDEVLPSWETRETGQWKDDRQKVFNDVHRLIRNLIDNTGDCTKKSTKTKEPVVYVIDDNMYFRSMRYLYYRLAKEYSLSFCQVYFDATLEHALEKNSKRKTSVPDDVIRRMHDKIEPPSLQNTWERCSIVVPAYADVKTNCEKIRELLEISLSSPVPCSDIEPDIHPPASVVHLVDIAVRKVISGKILEAKDLLDQEGFQKIINKFIERRKFILSNLKKGLILLPEEVTEQSTVAEILPLVKYLIYD